MSATTLLPDRLIPARPGLAGHGDRLLVALLDHRTAVWADDADANIRRDRKREWIRTVQSVKARRRRRKLGVLGPRGDVSSRRTP